MSDNSDSTDIITAEVLSTSEALQTVTTSELEAGILQAAQQPRDVREFRREAMELVTLDEDTAASCTYQLPRAGSTIEGPSARFAEICAYSWRNCRSGARIIGEDDKWLTAQGFFADLERNDAVAVEVRRRIVDRNGRKFNSDMVGTTANAATSIALRNAVLKGIPNALWRPIWMESKKTARGDIKTLAARRDAMLAEFEKLEVPAELVLRRVKASGIEAIDLDKLAHLRGIFQAIRDGDTTAADAFDLTNYAGGRVTKSEIKL